MVPAERNTANLPQEGPKVLRRLQQKVFRCGDIVEELGRFGEIVAHHGATKLVYFLYRIYSTLYLYTICKPVQS